MVIVMAFGTGASVVSARGGREGSTVSVRIAGAGVARGARERVRRRTKDRPDPGVGKIRADSVLTEGGVGTPAGSQRQHVL